MARFGCTLLAVMLAAAQPGVNARAQAIPPPAELNGVPVAMLVDHGSGRVLLSRKADLRFVPASMTKVMTAFVAFEEISAGRLALDRRFGVTEETAKVWSGLGTSMYLTPADRPTTDQLLRGIMTASANDAAVVLAQGHAGSIAAWSFLMNDSARRIGMTRSHFNTPNGWPDGKKTYVTARDLVSLGREMIARHPQLYARYSGKLEFDWNQRRLFSHDPVSGVVAGADGIKTGYTREAGFNFLGSAERDGRRLVMVVAGAKTDDQRRNASRALLEWGFANWRQRGLFDAGDRVGVARIQGGDERSVGLVVRRDTYATIAMAGSEPVSLAIAYKGPLVAPIRKGDKVADLLIRIGSGVPGRVPLYASRSVAKAGALARLRNGLMGLLP